MADGSAAASRRWTKWAWLGLAISAVGLLLRIEHALTFDQVHRASDYPAHLQGVQWMQEHWKPFFHDLGVNYQVRSYPPLWYFLSALILEHTGQERALAGLSVLGFIARHAALVLLLNRALPRYPLSRLAALSVHAFLPLGVLIDGKVNPESLHSGIFGLAIYFLFLIERQAQSSKGVSFLTAVCFGALSGLGLLAKITGSLLVVIGAVVFCWHTLRWLRRGGLRSAWLKVMVPGLAACAVWAAVGGWWSGTNMLRLGHPFPHVWDMDTPATNPILAEPVAYRRPMGWVLPFEWKQYWRFPIMRTPTNPRPNFWAVEITGTWADVYNRGFCRLKGNATTDYVWGGRHGFMDQRSDAWRVDNRCVEWFATMLHVGVWITVAAVLSVLWCLWRSLRSWGARGSFALPLVCLACTASGMWLALVYPYDNIVPLNPRYLLSETMPMSACLGIFLAQAEALGARRSKLGALSRSVCWTLLGLIGLIGLLVTYARFGW